MNDHISVKGRITIDNAEEMRQMIADAVSSHKGRVVIDVSKVVYIDTSGLATLLEALRNAAQNGRRLVLRGIQEQPRWLFEATELDHVFEIEEAGSQ